ncbi:MAG TPA: hypothetical protein VH186_36110 [Chloroflexia bacterium]|nr:hypothetical protein [Chloroflexia bacterium]
MSDYFIISPLEEIDWKIDLEDFIQKLVAEWSEAKVEIDNNPQSPYLLEFELKLGEYQVSRYVNRTALFMAGGDLKEYAEIAVWYRKIVPPRYQLFLYCAGDSPGEEFELLPETTEQDILNPNNWPLLQDDDE